MIEFIVWVVPGALVFIAWLVINHLKDDRDYYRERTKFLGSLVENQSETIKDQRKEIEKLKRLLYCESEGMKDE